ncbi:MAG TPA: penicillin-binding protein 2, partial [candidate division Zixibacteria bacterium]|nr:penicillin-binding protein 2 [candidate division Zixibacteria bacterium]
MHRTRTERIRLGILFSLVCLYFLAVAARLVHLQVVLHQKYADIVRIQSEGRVKIPAERGLIYDRYGRLVVNNVKCPSLYAYPGSQTELENAARYVEKMFGLKRGTARREYNLEVNKFSWIKRLLGDEFARHIEKTAPPGLYLRDETQRVYPYGLVGKQILGFTNIDNQGQSGLELAWDSLMKGEDGEADIRRDGLRNVFRVKEQAAVKPKPGQALVLTIDFNLQEIFERQLRKGVEEYGAKAGMGAFIDCRTGEILAMAHYDPKEEHPEKPVKLRAISDQFEPGSSFKAITAAALLEAGEVDFREYTYCEMGAWKMERGGTLKDDKKHGNLTFREIMELSSNIGVAKYGIRLGGENLYEAARKFGFGQKYGIGLGAEESGRVSKPRRWADRAVASLAMGHAVAVNCLQMANAFAAIANGGELLRPHLLMCCVDEHQKVTRRFGREVMQKVMEGVWADTLKAVLRGVVERGTATKVNSKAVAIAGKTGTAQIPDSVTHRYKDEYTASFAGFFPYEKPAIAGIVMLIEPNPIHYGGYTAGPIFRRTAEQYMILNPDLFDSGTGIYANPQGDG